MKVNIQIPLGEEIQELEHPVSCKILRMDVIDELTFIYF